MKKILPDVCLFRPEIPQNTGNIGRLVAAVNSRLHLVGPLGFSLENRYLKRAGLDYWPHLDWSVYEGFEAFVQSRERPPSLAFLSTKGTRSYTDIPVDTDVIVFGSETKGLSREIMESQKEHLYRIPMYNSNVRSLNLANSVSIVLYDQLAARSSRFSQDEPINRQ